MTTKMTFGKMAKKLEKLMDKYDYSPEGMITALSLTRQTDLGEIEKSALAPEFKSSAADIARIISVAYLHSTNRSIEAGKLFVTRMDKRVR